jgi:hypothetical protein
MLGPCACALMPRPLLLAACLLLGACAAPAPPPPPPAAVQPKPAAIEPPSTPKPAAFVPGVEGRGADEVCQSNSAECQQWTELAQKCEENMRQRDAGYMGRQEPYCGQMETYRERVTGVALSTAPGAYAF